MIDYLLDQAPDSHKDKNFLDFMNPNSLQVVKGYVEPSLATVKADDKFQFQRLGYFNVDKDRTAENIIFNKTVGLKDAWEEKGKKEENLLMNSLKEINKYFKVDDKSERLDIKNTIGENISSIENYSLLVNFFLKNINNNKSSLLFANYILRFSNKITSSDFNIDDITKFYTLSIKSESSYVRSQAISNFIKIEKDISFVRSFKSDLFNLNHNRPKNFTDVEENLLKQLLFILE